ncbi:MAG: vitamin B12-dependent ribonucleotide reductase [Myxococcota bacterium]|nr:vitamin B12-dependent ribonucleotide reductase [Myxococcota bacterium]
MSQVEIATTKKRRKSRRQKKIQGLTFSRKLTEAGRHPYDQIEWEHRRAEIAGDSGEPIFELDNAEVPAFWSQLATNVVASKYFRQAGQAGDRETSVRQIIDRVVDTIVGWGNADGYFSTKEDGQVFSDELKHIVLHQMATFNSPVWFNVGVEAHPIGSACFINSVEDSMESIMALAAVEANLFKGGSGSGTNLSTLRSSRERLSSGGRPSGPVSFMRGYDAFAGVIKSGGKTRRAAVMRILNVDHPDILEFIDCKVQEEKKAWALIDAGYDGSLNGEAYGTVCFQNANNSVSLSDKYMKAALNDRTYMTIAVLDGRPIEELNAKDVLRRIAEATHMCGDPGLQFDDTINRWHTCSKSGTIHGSNPCGEFVFLDDTACNLASINLMRFIDENGCFDVERFKHVVDIMITAQDIIVNNARYPTERIARNSKNFRPLGLGFANLGAMLMSLGLPYDSDAGRGYAASVAALMTAEAYAQSARIAEAVKPFAKWTENAEDMMQVIRMHQQVLESIDTVWAPKSIFEAAIAKWREVIELGSRKGFSNAQVTALAPTGTIAFMMDCDTTGIEPDIALVKYKQLAGGGSFKLVSRSVPRALAVLGYSVDEINQIESHIEMRGTIEGAPALKAEHLPVFDCAIKPRNGARTIAPMGHIKMMAAVQPFISGAISKTVNVPTETHINDIVDIYIDAWKLGLKSLAIYRDGSKRTQPLSTRDRSKIVPEQRAVRTRLPDERKSITHKFDVSGHEGYITAGLYDNGSLGEIFVRMAKEGSAISGLMDSFATAISIALQYGVPLKVLVKKFRHTRFEPSGVTRNPEIPIAKSAMDYIFRWLELRFLNQVAETAPDHVKPADKIQTPPQESDAPPCPNCGSIMVRSGACYRCLNCGSNSGCG